MPFELRNAHFDAETILVLSVVSDAMRRGVTHFRVDGTPLADVNDVLSALRIDGQILVEAEGAEQLVGH